MVFLEFLQAYWDNGNQIPQKPWKTQVLLYRKLRGISSVLELWYDVFFRL